MPELTYNNLDHTYRTTLGTDEVIVGGKNPLVFEPEICFTKWNKENSLTLKLPPDLISNTTPTLAKELTIGDSKTGFYFAPQDDGVNFKFGVIWKEKPASNSVSFQLENWEDYNFIKQDVWVNYEEVTLTKEQSPWGVEGIHIKKTDEPRKGSIRLPKVQGAYAIYHKTKKWQEVGKTDYGTGQTGFWYRPRFIDATGKFVWGEIEIKDGVAVETCPLEFLNTAVYSVSSNAEFGNTNVGGNSSVAENSVVYAARAVLSATGTITGISVYLYNSDTSAHNVVSALYSDTDDSPVTRLVVGSAGNVPASSTDWRESAISDVQRSAATFHLAFLVDTAEVISFYYNESGGIFNVDVENEYPTFPATFASVYDDASYISIKATYTAGGGAVILTGVTYMES